MSTRSKSVHRSDESDSDFDNPAKRPRTPNPNEVFHLNDIYSQQKDTDVTIYSCDRLPFHVHSYILQSSSTVFRDLLNIPQYTSNSPRPEIHLTDPELERSLIIRLYLDIAYGNEALKGYTLKSKCEIQDLLDLIDFLVKYDMKTTLNTLKMTLKLMTTTGQISPLGIFIAGSRLEDVEICSYAIKTPGTVGWSARRIARSRLGSGDNPLMDIHLAPIWHFTRIRPTYSSALLKVTKYFTFSQASAEEKDCIAREFEMAISLFRQQGI